MRAPLYSDTADEILAPEAIEELLARFEIECDGVERDDSALL